MSLMDIRVQFHTPETARETEQKLYALRAERITNSGCVLEAAVNEGTVESVRRLIEQNGGVLDFC
ncbi:hypothetical protein [Paenibacillus beijingensis]|uniref:Uncharacterized protein n=1 Tax=Paenibacillus beijingensis TaxID=1126833 RepID=A0A0D5NMZ8_9BACL|nr:hypothetical protein [Paenibacillus beijingensis]AJY76298.1 hypothetical protein VN24_19180 [Paenibacillus beijingensis]